MIPGITMAQGCALWMIVGSMMLEKLAGFVRKMVMIKFLTDRYNFSAEGASTVMLVWDVLSNVSPVLGGLVADLMVGPYVAVMIGWASTFIGTVILLESSLVEDSHISAMYVGIAFMVIGAGLLRPCIVALGAQEASSSRSESDRRTAVSTTRRYFNLRHASLGTALLLGSMLDCIVGKRITAARAFTGASALTALGAASFLLGSTRKDPSLGKLKIFPLRMLPLSLSYMILVLTQIQDLTEMHSQGVRISNQITVFMSLILQLLFAVVCDSMVLPLLGRVTIITLKKRVASGFLFSTIAVTIAGFLEWTRHPSLMCMLPQVASQSMADTLGVIGTQHMIFHQTPKTISCIGMSIPYLAGATAKLLNLLLRKLAATWIDAGHYDYYFWLLAVIGAVNLATFMYVCGDDDGEEA